MTLTVLSFFLLNFLILVTDPTLFTPYCSKTYDNEWLKRIVSMVWTKPISNWPPASPFGNAEGAQKIRQGSPNSQLLDHKILEHLSFQVIRDAGDTDKKTWITSPITINMLVISWRFLPLVANKKYFTETKITQYFINKLHFIKLTANYLTFSLSFEV